MQTHKPYAPACDNNKDPILNILKHSFIDPGLVLEIGSGTGQHAVYFSENLPHIIWQPTDIEENIAGITAWQTDANLSNLKPPLKLDVAQKPWPDIRADYVFSANAVHIMPWKMVERLFRGIEKNLKFNGLLVLYGPFNYAGRYTSSSNAQFDNWLKERDPHSGIRDFEAINILAENAGMLLREDYEMPANNRSLIWKKCR